MDGVLLVDECRQTSPKSASDGIHDGAGCSAGGGVTDSITSTFEQGAIMAPRTCFLGFLGC